MGLSLLVAAAILVIEIEDVFVARMVCSGQISAICLKIEALRERISGTASITKSAFERSIIFVEAKSRAREAVASACVKRFLDTSFARS